MGKSAIIGLHGDKLMALLLEERLDVRGYQEIVVVKTPSEMDEKCSVRNYNLYIMDVNLGFPERYDFSCAHRTYERIRLRVDSGEIKFYPLAAFEDAVKAARSEGLPALSKGSFDEKFEELLGPVQLKLNH